MLLYNELKQLSLSDDIIFKSVKTGRKLFFTANLLIRGRGCFLIEVSVESQL